MHEQKKINNFIENFNIYLTLHIIITLLHLCFTIKMCDGVIKITMYLFESMTLKTSGFNSYFSIYCIIIYLYF